MSDKVKNMKQKVDNAKELVASLKARAYKRTYEDITGITEQGIYKKKSRKDVKCNRDDREEMCVDQGYNDRESHYPKDQANKQLAAQDGSVKQKENKDLQDLEKLEGQMERTYEDVTGITEQVIYDEKSRKYGKCNRDDPEEMCIDQGYNDRENHYSKDQENKQLAAQNISARQKENNDLQDLEKLGGKLESRTIGTCNRDDREEICVDQGNNDKESHYPKDQANKQLAAQNISDKQKENKDLQKLEKLGGQLERPYEDITGMTEEVIYEKKSRAIGKCNRDDREEICVDQGYNDRESHIPKDQANKPLAGQSISARQKENKDLQDLEKLGGLLEDVTKDLDSLDAENRGTPQKTDENKWSFTSLFTSKAKTIQVLLTQQTPSIEEFMRELKGKIKTIAFEVINDVSKLQQKFIVVSPSLTRLEPDIDLSLQSLDRSKILAAVVLHQVRPGEQPLLDTQKKIGQQEKYSGITFIDIAFDTDEKIYSCEMNTKAETAFKALAQKA